MNPILDKIQALYTEGLHINAVGADKITNGRWQVWIGIADMLPLGEGGDLPHHVVKVDLDNLPKGVSAFGFEKYPNEVFEVEASYEGIEHFMREVAREGKAQDLCRFDGDAPTYPHLLTKPTAWF